MMQPPSGAPRLLWPRNSGKLEQGNGAGLRGLEISLGSGNPKAVSRGAAGGHLSPYLQLVLL